MTSEKKRQDMAFIVEAVQGDGHQDTAPLLRDGKIYTAKIAAVLPTKKKKFQSDEYQDAARVVFDLFQKNGQEIGTVSKKYTLSLNEKASLFALVKTVMGAAPSEKFDLETLVGKPCQILIELWTTSGGADRNGVGNVLPADDDDDEIASANTQSKAAFKTLETINVPA
jgi:hypothetical protein